MPATPGGLVLVADENSTLRAHLANALRISGYQSLEAATAAQARGMARAPISAAILAERLPDGAAAELVSSFRVPVIVVVAQERSELAQQAVNAGARGVIERSRAREQIVGVLRRVLTEARAGKTPAPEPVRPVADPGLPTQEPTTRMATASGEELALIAALRDELAFLRQASYFRILELEPEAGDDQVRAAGERFNRRWHPDRLRAPASQDMRAIAGEIYLLGQAAFEVLTDPARSAEYRRPPAPPAMAASPKVARLAAPPARTASPQPAGPRPAQRAKPAAESAARVVDPRPQRDINVDELFAGLGSELAGLEGLENQRLAVARAHLRDGRRTVARTVLDELLLVEPGNGPARALVHVVAALDGAIPQDEMARHIDQALQADASCPEALALQRQMAEMRAQGRRSLLRRILGRE
jgi:DNA-binding response OmpR family regulator